MSMPGHERIIFPLDVDSEAKAWDWCMKLKGEVGIMKVGLELFTRLGPAALSAPRANGFDIMLDLKLHDIPNTVGKAVESAVSHENIKFVTVHASGGIAMMRRAVDATKGTHTTILAITALTSLDGEDLKGVYGSEDPLEVVHNLAEMAYRAGARGFVCSPKEVGSLSGKLPDATFVVPGIRPAGSATDDQKRSATPEAAAKAGADYLVVGRPIRNADHPQTVCKELAASVLRGFDRR